MSRWWLVCLQVEPVVGVDGMDHCVGLGGIEHAGRLCARTHAIFRHPLGGGETNTSLLFGAQLVEPIAEVGRIGGEGVVDLSGVVTVSWGGSEDLGAGVGARELLVQVADVLGEFGVGEHPRRVAAEGMVGGGVVGEVVVDPVFDGGAVGGGVCGAPVGAECGEGGGCGAGGGEVGAAGLDVVGGVVVGDGGASVGAAVVAEAVVAASAWGGVLAVVWRSIPQSTQANLRVSGIAARS